MRVHGNCRRLTAVLLSLTLLCGIAALPATAASVGEVVRAGIPENAVPGDIRITTYAVPNEAQMAGLREDAAQKTPDGFVFYGWYVTGEKEASPLPTAGLKTGSVRFMPTWRRTRIADSCCNICTSPRR